MGIFDFLSRKPNITKLETNQDIDGLITALNYEKEVSIQVAAANALGNLRDNRAIEPLSILFKERDDQPVELRIQALKSLAKLDLLGALNALITVLNSRKPADREIPQSLVKEFDGDPIPVLGKLVKETGDFQVRNTSIRLLAEFGNEQALAELKPHLDSDDSNVRIVVTRELGNFGKAVEPILKAKFTDSSSSVRLAAVEAFGAVADDKTLANLITSLNKDDDELYKAMLGILKSRRIETPETVISLYGFYQYSDRAIPSGDGRCSDRQCPCNDTVIPHGSGHLYISQEAVDFMRKAKRNPEAVRNVMFAPMPVLVCDDGAFRRGLDLKTSSADAKRWWETGQVPLRKTPKSK